jgi:hypothetical protein
MLLRHGWLVASFLCLGCHTLAALEFDGEPTSTEKATPAERAVAAVEPAPADDTPQVSTDVGLAAERLEVGDEAGACVHLARHVAAHPEQLTVRSHYAELLMRLKRPDEARKELEGTVVTAQEMGDGALKYLIHCHSRLMELAEDAEDEYAEHLHRGIGLYLLARRRALLDDPDGELATETLLCKAAGELALARLERPTEARPCWYLYSVWSKLAQHRPARRWLREADAAAPTSYLTPAEQRSLELACRSGTGNGPR